MPTVEYKGAKLPMFVPCIGGRCPEQMQLEGWRDPSKKKVYRCMRKVGGKRRGTGEIYTEDCYYREHPYPADDYAYWHRNPDKPTRPKQEKETDEIFKTFI